MTHACDVMYVMLMVLALDWVVATYELSGQLAKVHKPVPGTICPKPALIAKWRPSNRADVRQEM
jgi:hypothetical protein